MVSCLLGVIVVACVTVSIDVYAEKPCKLCVWILSVIMQGVLFTREIRLFLRAGLANS